MKSLIVIFGFPGVGKTYIGEILRDIYGYYLHDGDIDIPKDMKERIDHARPLTVDMRDEFFQKLLEHIQDLAAVHERLVVTQTFIKEKYRTKVKDAFPTAKFIYIEADEKIREHRLKKRTNYPLDIDYAKKMTGFFEKPKIKHDVIINNISGT